MGFKGFQRDTQRCGYLLRKSEGRTHPSLSYRVSLVVCLFDLLVGWLFGLLVGWLACWLAGWLVGWLACWLAGWLVGWLVGSCPRYVRMY